ncbi:MAG: hypothetical protein JNK82_21930 [Myxococcaceae bacterium]|nr:hypothetical protein [Myxococcaceae bacterium]
MLFALVMLVVVLAMIATMSLANLTRQKMEMQIANDTAAYSQAIAAARTYNSVALLNRAQVATMVAVQGIHSAVSFAGTYRGALNATMFAYQDDLNREFGDCQTWERQYNFTGDQNEGERNACELVDQVAQESSCNRAKPNLLFGIFYIGCNGEACDARNEILGNFGLFFDSCLVFGTGRVQMLKREWCRVRGLWDTLDDPTGAQARRAQAEAVFLGARERTALEGTLPGALPSLANSAVATIGGTANVAVGTAEVGRAYAGGGSYNGLEAALGSRAHPFISGRADGRRALEDQLRRVVEPSGAPPDEIQLIAPLLGSSYFIEPDMWDARYDTNHGKREPAAWSSWADEHGEVSVSYRGNFTSQRTPGVADVRWARRFRGSQSATDEQHQGDTHDWCPQDLKAEARDPFLRHTLLPHNMPPPNEPDPCENESCIWPGFYDVNAAIITSRDDVWGQPKLLTVVSKDLSAVKDPWNMFFKLQFAQGGAPVQVDFRTRHAVAGVMPEFQSVAAGMAYYHRPQHWKEHPNMFNPYWRATLVRSNIDTTWQGDLTSNVAGVNAAAINALVTAGYRGIP